MANPYPRPTFDEEQAVLDQGFYPIAGLDEAGRGPLAGPVVAGAVAFTRHFNPPWLNLVRDSKDMTPKQREYLFSLVEATGVAWATGVVDAQEVDEIGIVGATRRAMLLAVRGLPEPPTFLLIDALPLPESGVPFKALVKGDRRSFSIAAASVMAKVIHDRIMVEEDTRYPGYGFASHKGYPTRSHLEHLLRLGPSPIHRRSFGPVRALLEGRPPAPNYRGLLGGSGEREARRHLEEAGYTILDTNFRCPYGEVDIVALHGECVVFLEVRTRSSNAFGSPEESVTPAKRRRLIATAETYLQSKDNLPQQWRIDLVAIETDLRGRTLRLDIIENAVTAQTDQAGLPSRF